MINAEKSLAREWDHPASVVQAATLTSQCWSPVRLAGMEGRIEFFSR